MKVHLLAIFVLAAGSVLAIAQAGPSISNVTATVRHSAPPSPTQLAPTAVVIAIHGLCAKEPANAVERDTCVTNITREQFERMLGAMSFNPQMLSNPVAVRGFAESYVQALAQADAAEKAGVDKDPNFEQLMEIIRVRALADAYRRFQQDSAKQVPSEEIEAYYNEHASSYEQVELDRIFIPRVSAKPTKEDKQTFEKRARQLADRAHDRAVKGEEMLKLQADTYKELGLTPPLNTDIGTVRRGKVPAAFEADIFSARAGEVTKVEEDPAGFTIYRVRARTALPLEQVTDEIVHAIAQKKIEAATKVMADQVHSELNEQFFMTQHASLHQTQVGVSRTQK